MFTVARLELARKRRRLTAKKLAENAGISPVTLSRIVKGRCEPEADTVARLADALGYPLEFFFLDEVDLPEPDAVSFRSLSSMTARERDAAVAAGALAYEFSDWLQQRFNLPESDIPNFGRQSRPETTARMLREYWGIGEKPIGNFLKLLEAKGIRVFSLAEDTKNVDAFSCWRNGEPYMFLNTYKTAERSRFDAAHELGHLVMHRHGGPSGRESEAEADAFASSFLMPSADVLSIVPRIGQFSQILKLKKRWGVSAAALTYRLNKLGLLSDWMSRGFYIRLREEFQNSEPEGMPQERSVVFDKILTELWKDGLTRSHIARELTIPVEELNGLLFGLLTSVQSETPRKSKRHLYRVK